MLSTSLPGVPATENKAVPQARIASVVDMHEEEGEVWVSGNERSGAKRMMGMSTAKPKRDAATNT